MRKRSIFIVAGMAGILFLGSAAAWLAAAPPSNEKARSTAAIGGAFELTDQDGQRVTEKDLLGKPSAVFFGFTLCPDLCPTTLLQMTTWLKALGTDADKLNIVFVSVDSESDTPEQMKLYLSSFDPHIRGFTGSDAQIRQITKAYRVFYQRVALEGGGYTYDHSAMIYLMDQSGRYVGLVTHKEAEEAAVAKLRSLIAAARS